MGGGGLMGWWGAALLARAPSLCADCVGGVGCGSVAVPGAVFIVHLNHVDAVVAHPNVALVMLLTCCEPLAVLELKHFAAWPQPWWRQR